MNHYCSGKSHWVTYLLHLGTVWCRTVMIHPLDDEQRLKFAFGTFRQYVGNSFSRDIFILFLIRKKMTAFIVSLSDKHKRILVELGLRAGRIDCLGMWLRKKYLSPSSTIDTSKMLVCCSDIQYPSNSLPSTPLVSKHWPQNHLRFETAHW